jgi:F-type H+-transporting ATPase subunit delta
MADRSTIARPYARAAFEEALAAKRLEPWSQALHAAAAVVADARVTALLGNPHVRPDELAALVSGIAAAKLGDAGGNFLRTLAANRRLAVLAEIATRFDELKDAAEGVADVTVTAAVPLDARQRQALSAALERRLRRTVRLHCATDAALIGGAVVHSGDLVIDGSLRTRLERIAYELTA